MCYCQINQIFIFGPFAVNISTFVGFPGAVCATLGVTIPSLLVMLFAARHYDKFRKSRIVKGCMAGLKPAVIGMLAASFFPCTDRARLYMEFPDVLHFFNYTFHYGDSFIPENASDHNYFSVSINGNWYRISDGDSVKTTHALLVQMDCIRNVSDAFFVFQGQYRIYTELIRIWQQNKIGL